jgi:hypothetical protein
MKRAAHFLATASQGLCAQADSASIHKLFPHASTFAVENIIALTARPLGN